MTTSQKPVLHVLVTSTRPGRIGPALGEWVKGIAETHEAFTVELVDLASFKLPIFDEPNHPLMQKYEREHTHAWAAKVSEADAFVFVLPEYDFFPPASVVNAMQYLSKEWNYKPLILMSYSIGPFAGVRSAQILKMLAASLKMMPMAEAITVPMAKSLIAEDGSFTGNEIIEKSAVTALNELARWTEAMRGLRA